MKNPVEKSHIIYSDLLMQPHLLIAGCTGSGKSVVINGIIKTAITRYKPKQIQFIFIDLKKVELVEYKHSKYCLLYANNQKNMITALQAAINIINCRYTYMSIRRLKKYNGSHIYIVIDELADLMTTNKKQVAPLIQRIAQIGRAANVHLIVATQCPIREVIPTQIKCNFDARVALRTRSAQDSRNILGVSCCEKLPRYGYGYYMNPDCLQLIAIPLIA